MTDQQNPYVRFREIAEAKGVAATSTADGYLLMFRRDYLSNLLLGDTSPDVNIGIDTNGKVKSVSLSRNKLQATLDANPDAPLLAVIYTHKPISN